MIVFVVGTLNGRAIAQVQLPQFSISNIPTIELEGNLTFDYEQAFASINNPMMRDTIILQYQINLLEKLIRRQTEIQRIAESFESIGIPFDQPAPPETACQQLPVNMLCMAFYPESVKYKDLIDERRKEFERDQRRQLDIMMQGMSMESVQQTASDGTLTQIAPPAPQKISPNRQYIWSDIRCVAGKCSALLVNQNDRNMRFRIRDGEDLPDDGGTITKISMDGVKAKFEGETYTLNPEAVDGGVQVDNRQDTSNIANLLNDNLGDEAANSPAIQAANDAAIAPQILSTDQNAPAPMLGVTGLF